MKSGRHLSFPVLVLRPGRFCICTSFDTLTTGDKNAIAKGKYRGNVIVDAAGRTFDIRSAEGAGGLGPVWRWNLGYDRRIRLRYVLEERAEPMAAGELRATIAAIYRRRAGAEEPDDVRTVLKRIARTAGVRDLLGVFDGTSYVDGLWF